MTKDAYFEMCEVLGSTPVEEEIPFEFEDFPLGVQLAFIVYQNLQDNWEPVSGQYLGKIRQNFVQVLDLLGIGTEDHKEIFTLVNLIDSVRIALVKNASK